MWRLIFKVDDCPKTRSGCRRAMTFLREVFSPWYGVFGSRVLLSVALLFRLGLYADGVATKTLGDCTWLYTVKSGTVTISSVWPIRESMEIPEQLDGCPVVALKDSFCSGSSDLVCVKIPCTVTSIGQSAFSNCPNLKSVEMPSSVVGMGQGAFRCCPGLIDADGFVIVGDWLCGYFGSEYRLVLPSCVKKIRDYAISSMTLREIEIGSELQTVGAGAFSGCPALERIDVNGENKLYASIDGVLYDKDMSVLLSCPAMKRSVALPSTVKAIEGHFEECEDLETIDVDSDNAVYKDIGGILYSKDGKKLLRCPRGKDSISIAPGTTELCEFALAGCNRLKTVVVPEGVEAFKWSVFNNCENLQFVFLPATLKNMSELVFDGCANLRMINVAEGKKYSSIDGVLYDHDGVTLLVLPSGMDHYAIPSGVTDIGYPGFYHCTKLATVAIPNSLTSIHSGALNLCDKLNAVYVDAGDIDRVRTLLKSQFYYIDGLSFLEIIDVQVPDGPLVNSAWAMNFGNFVPKFGSDFAKALVSPSGKLDSFGSPMLVWHDYVAGTDPTDEANVFKTTIAVVDGKPIISWTPELKPEQAALRNYTIYGKVKLQDTAWQVVEGDAENYNFFKVSVRMKSQLELWLSENPDIPHDEESYGFTR